MPSFLKVAKPIDWLDHDRLVNGSGFTGAHPQPINVGVTGATGYTAKAIARWSTVPWQTATPTVNVGVVAFHRNGIERVAFTANNGPWLNVYQPTYNPETKTVEYWCIFDSTNFPAGSVEIRAIAYPQGAGVPRVLQGLIEPTAGALPPIEGVYSLNLWSNPSGTYDRTPIYISSSGSNATGTGTEANPYATMVRAMAHFANVYGSADNCTIYCKPGTYEYNANSGGSELALADSRYLTVSAAPGVDRSQVILTEGRPRSGRLKLSNVKILGEPVYGSFYDGFTTKQTSMWVKDCIVTTASGRWSEPNGSNPLGQCARYIEDTQWYDIYQGPVTSVIVRNNVISKITSDAVSGCMLCCNNEVYDADAGLTSGAHTDIIQIFYDADTPIYDNHIVYGLKAIDVYAQGWFIAQLTNGIINNSAFVNMMLDCTDQGQAEGLASQLQKDAEHLLLLNCTFNQVLVVTPPTPTFTNCKFQGNIFKKVVCDATAITGCQAIDWSSNHFYDTTGYLAQVFGSDASTGPIPYQGITANNFHPIAGSSLEGRVPRLVRNDVSGSHRSFTHTLGAYEH